MSRGGGHGPIDGRQRHRTRAKRRQRLEMRFRFGEAQSGCGEGAKRGPNRHRPTRAQHRGIDGLGRERGHSLVVSDGPTGGWMTECMTDGNR
jgi:hypothetical protein